jgi:large subunit ribosomal protein L9
MKVILMGELRGKGGEGDIVDVAQGFAENYLFPNKIAQPATPGNLKQLEQRRDSIEKREAERIANAQATKARSTASPSRSTPRSARTASSLAPSPRSRSSDAIKAQLGVEVDRKRIGRGDHQDCWPPRRRDQPLPRHQRQDRTVLVGDRAEPRSPRPRRPRRPEAREAPPTSTETPAE